MKGKMTEAVVKTRGDSAATRELLSRAEEQGYLTVDDILELLPEAEEDLPEVEDLMARLYAEGIEVISSNGHESLQVLAEEGDTATPPPSAADVSRIDSHDSVGLYLKQMSVVPLLTREEEVRLAKQIERGEIAQRRLEKGGQRPYLRRRYQRQMQAGKRARAHLIRANTRLVVSIAKRYMHLGVPLLDLIQEGNIGLMKAVDKFDYRRGCKFSTYATWWIRQAVTRALSRQARVIRLPSHIGYRIRNMYRHAQQIEQKTGNRPTPKEVAQRMAVSPAKVRWLMKVSRRPLSLQKPVGEEQDSELGQFIEDKDATPPAEEALKSVLVDKVDQVLSTLTPREARILRLRFGLRSGRPHTLKEVAAKYGLTRERIRQIERKALRRLRHPSRSRQLRAYL
jgi:RNA polymerase primary sigma factor